MTKIQFIVVLVALGVLAILWVTSPEFRSLVIRFIFGRVDLQLRELPQILAEISDSGYDAHDTSRGGGTSVTFLHGGAQIYYEHVPQSGLEYIGVKYPRRWGLRLTIKEGVVALIERPWGRRFNYPNLSSVDKVAVDLLVRMLKEMIDPNFAA